MDLKVLIKSIKQFTAQNYQTLHILNVQLALGPKLHIIPIYSLKYANNTQISFNIHFNSALLNLQTVIICVYTFPANKMK